MRNFADISEDQVKAIYNATPSCNQYMTWEEVKDFEPMYDILKMQAVDHENDKQSHAVAVQQEKNCVQYGLTVPPILTLIKSNPPKPEATAIKKSKVIVIGKSRADKIAHALCLARNCLQSGVVNDSLKNEALRELAEVQQFLKPPQHGKK